MDGNTALIVSAIAGSTVLALATVIGYVWRKIDVLAKDVAELPHRAQEKATAMDDAIRQEIAGLRAEQTVHVAAVNTMHLQNVQQMSKFPTREEMQVVIDRGVQQIIMALRSDHPRGEA